MDSHPSVCVSLRTRSSRFSLSCHVTLLPLQDGRNPPRRGATSEFCQGISPYCLPVINNFVTPVPPTTKRRDRGTRVTSNGTIRGRRLRSTTAPGGGDANEVIHL